MAIVSNTNGPDEDFSFVIKDSGKRETFAGGMQRDTTEGKINWALVADGPMLKRWAIHLTNGAKKYEARNWMKAEGQAELDRARESAFRHFQQWFDGQIDEDHASAVYFNINECEFIKNKLGAARSLDWAGGIFEGEGSIVINRRSIQLTLYSTDLDVVDAFYKTVNIGSIKGPRKQRNLISHGPAKDMWEWHAYSSDAKQVLELLLPFLGSRRRAKAEEALSIKPLRNTKSGRKMVMPVLQPK